ncbi:MAG: hypothetical protein KC656_17920, partial [Myxococcales bacterium]|nr:hypothetical protein [Myxococcales bacterium]
VLLACSTPPAPPDVPSPEDALARIEAHVSAGRIDDAIADAGVLLETLEDDRRNDLAMLRGQLQVAAGRPVVVPDGLDPAVVATCLRSRAAGSGIATVAAAVVARYPTEELHGIRAGLAWQHDDLQGALESAGWLREHGSLQGRLEGALLVARLQEADRAAVAATYAEACPGFEGELGGRCRREQGLFLSEDPTTLEGAREALRESIRLSTGVMRSRTRVALGVIEAHEGATEAARPLLEAAVEGLPAGDPERAFAEQHLAALGTGACGCEAFEVE